jgi:tetrahydromethanopterin S-methyltransferase subunit B
MNYRVVPALMLATCLAVASPARADVVTEWNEIADNIFVTAPPFKNRVMAMVQVAVHDALNSIDPRYESYTGVPRANGAASPGAAVAAAAYQVLLQTVPGQAAALGVIYNGKIAGLSCPASHPTCITEGIVAGEAAAFAILSLRANEWIGHAEPAVYAAAGARGSSADAAKFSRSAICRLGVCDAVRDQQCLAVPGRSVGDLLLGQRLRPALDEESQEVERLRRQADLLVVREEPPLVEVDHEVAERESHDASAHMMARVWGTPCSTFLAKPPSSRAGRAALAGLWRWDWPTPAPTSSWSVVVRTPSTTPRRRSNVAGDEHCA